MNTKYLKIASTSAIIFAVLTSAATLRAAPATSGGTTVGQKLPASTFANSAEAATLKQAYVILATGDHDYKGHRVRAMRQIEAAAKLLGLALSGDAKDKQPQALSDAKLREVEGMLQVVLGNAEVKNQKRVAKHIEAAISQLNTALAIR